jgi:TM2 domain.
MPKCKYCGQSITKFDKEICPYCGGKNPLNGNNSQTVDITESIKTVNPTDESRVNFKPKNHILNAILCMFLGFLGLDELYLGFKKRFLIRLCINAISYVVIVLVLYFTNKSSSPILIFVVPLLVVFVVWFVVGAVFIFIKNKKDANGVFLK